MVPIVSIPLVVKDFCSLFSEIFNHPEQEKHFEALVTGLSVSDNKTIAGIHQSLLNGPTYEGLHHFMTDSPWSIDGLRQKRFQYVKSWLLKERGATSIAGALGYEGAEGKGSKQRQLLGSDARNNSAALMTVGKPEAIDKLMEKSVQVLKAPNQESKLPTVTALDATFIHHVGENIYGVYWFWDYAQRRYTRAQRVVLSTLATPKKLIPLGWKLFHRGFLDEQKLYLDHVKPADDADEKEWEEYNSLVEKYEQNQKEHKTQHYLAGELVDECEKLGLPIDGYVCDAALAVPELMDKIEATGKAWVSKLAKNRLVQTDKGGFEPIASFAHSLPKDVFKPVAVETRHGEKRTYWCFSKCVVIYGWKKLRVVISYDNEELEGEPIYLLTNKKEWVQPQKTVQFYMMRDPIEHQIRDGKQQLGLEDSQQRTEKGVQKHWELSFTAHTFLEVGLEVPILPGVPTVRLETIGQKCRVLEGALWHGFVNLIKQWVLEKKDTEELFQQIMTKRLNRLAA